MKKLKNNDRGKRRTKAPEIYVRVGDFGVYSWRSNYARASIEKRGEYQYLKWRDGKTVRRFYLGKKRDACSTTAAGQVRARGR